MNKSNYKIRGEIKDRVFAALQNTLLDSDKLKQARPIMDLADKCKEHNIDSNHIAEAGGDNTEEISDVFDAVKNRDEFFFIIASKIASRISKILSPYISDLTISQIKIITENDQHGVQASITLFSKTVKPYIQFVLVTNPAPIGRKEILRIDFQIDVSGKISDLKMLVTSNKKQVSGKLQYTIKGAVVKFNTTLGSVSTDIELVKKEFEADLVNFII
jgi:hypothetical protein